MVKTEWKKHLDDLDKVYPKISKNAYYILRGDQFSFGIMPTKGKENRVNTKLARRIFVNCCDAIIDELRANNMKRAYLDTAVKTLNLNCNDEISGKLMSDILTDEIWEAFGGMNKHSPNKLVSYVIEQYADKAYPEREKIYFSAEYSQIMSAVENNEFVRFRGSSKQERTFLPIGIMSDEWSTYNYIVGLSVPEGKISVNRLSRVSGIKIVKNEKILGNIDDMRKKAEETIARKGIMFVSSEIPGEGIKVQMTDRGVYMFNTMVFMRPIPIMMEKISQNNFSWEYTFDCTELQARNYFFKFGKDVRVVSPKKLRDTFKKDILTALKEYDVSEDDIDVLRQRHFDTKENHS